MTELFTSCSARTGGSVRESSERTKLKHRTRIREDIDRGVSVIADRYAFSGIAFSAAKVSVETVLNLYQGLSFDYCLGPDRGLPLPDVVIYLTLSPEAASRRGEYGGERYETLDMQRKTREQFGSVKREMEGNHKGVWVDVDAEGTVEEVAERIRASIPEVSGSLGDLWT